MFAPMSLTSYEETRVRGRVRSRTASPSGRCRRGARTCRTAGSSNDPRLTDQEIETIVSWVDGGAPKGDLADMPKLPAMADGWTIGKPDAVFSMTEDFKIPATGTIDYKHPDSGEPAGGPVAPPRRDQTERARGRAPHHRLHGAPQRSADARGSTFGPTNITGVSPNKPGLVFEPGIAKLLRAGHRHHPADALHDQRRRSHRSHASRGHLRQGAAEAKVHVTGLAVQPSS